MGSGNRVPASWNIHGPREERFFWSLQSGFKQPGEWLEGSDIKPQEP